MIEHRCEWCKWAVYKSVDPDHVLCEITDRPVLRKMSCGEWERELGADDNKTSGHDYSNKAGAIE